MKKINLTKFDLAKEISLKSGLSVQFSKKIVENILDILKINIKEKKLNIKNFGTFKILKKKARVGRNPRTNEVFFITKRKSISFTASKKFISEVNKK